MSKHNDLSLLSIHARLSSANSEKLREGKLHHALWADAHLGAALAWIRSADMEAAEEQLRRAAVCVFGKGSEEVGSLFA